ncbi:LPS O-antigen chain length determinant protein WzzB [Halopseudomonas yangmingensis]|uniref:LPS O-antigen chain length determinant protein, WzzB/FepE family n=1 Tax=Halopseudomonas yangmingensis TaxID=1720063 RepID=A0A1I4T226_9GAMM|nr:Wzz/FepE/Etk N-terminal domain-containing protein [Halopseudomonas yangmingensis]SFM70784.1 LPS O-antigen chain length determinant protein, WzzB/FepE family [Halopseudomonas yangmingensis]
MSDLTPQAHFHDDEIDLFELAENLWKEKILIALVTAVVTFIALAYALLATPQYQTQSTVRPTVVKSLDELNRLGVYKLKPGEALALVAAELDSYEARLDYYRNNRELFSELESESRSLEQNFARINQDAVKVIRPDPKKTDTPNPFVSLQFSYPRGVDGPQIVNGMVQHAIARALQDVTADHNALVASRLSELDRKINTARAAYEAEIEVRIAKLTESDELKRVQLNDELNALRTQLRQRRENRIAQLEEAISIASALGIKKPTTPSGMSQEQRSTGNVVRTEVTNQTPPLYFMGTDALEAERKALQSRTSDDFTAPRIVEINKELQLLENNRTIEMLQARENEDLFLAELAKLRSERARLKSLELDPQKLSLVRIDQVAVQPVSAIKPKKPMILALGIVLGGMLGGMIALMRIVIRKRKQAEKPA